MDFHDRQLFDNAIKSGNLEEAASLLESRGLFRIDFHNFLSRAVVENDLAILRLLLHHEMQRNRSLYLICLLNKKGFGDRPMIEAILPHCTFVTPRDQYLIYAIVRNGYLPIVVDRVNIDVNMVHFKSNLNFLTIACLNKHHQVVERLLQHGAHTNSTISSKNEILNNHERVGPNLRTYLDFYSSDYHRIKDEFNITYLHIAVFNSDWMTTEALLRYGERITEQSQLFILTCIAAKDGCTEIVGRFLSLGVSATGVSPQGKSILHFCVQNLYLKDYGYNIAKLLLERGGDIHIKKPKNKIFIDAITNKHYKTARLLLDWNVVQYIGPDGNTVLHKAIECDFDDGFVKTLLDFNLPVNFKNEYGLTPLHVACTMRSKNKLPVIKTLLQYNADVQCTDNNRRRPLHYACSYQNEDLVAIFLSKGANPNDKDDKGLTPLRYIITYRENKTSEIIKWLLDHHANIDDTDDLSWTPLNIACMTGNHDLAKCLLDNNANPNAVDQQLRTPLHYICYYGGDEALKIIQLLLERGANIEAMDLDGRSPFFLACEAADDGIIEYLLDNHANSCLVDLKNLTPLNIVLQNYMWNFETVNILLKNGKVHNIDNKGQSIAHYVAETKDNRFITIFAAMGVDFNSVDDEGNTPLHVAVGKSCVEMTTYLIKYGVDINIANKNGKTPLQEALEMVNPTHTLIKEPFQWKERIVTELTDQVVMLKVAGLKVSEQNLDIVYDSKYSTYLQCYVRELEVECDKEIQMMKKESTGVDDLTFCDLLKSHSYPSSKVVENNKMKGILELEIYNKKYPLYIHIIRKRLREATTLRKINKLRNSAKKYFKLNITQQLPEECIDMILDYLDKEELNMLAELYDLSEDNQETWLGNARKFIKNVFDSFVVL